MQRSSRVVGRSLVLPNDEKGSMFNNTFAAEWSSPSAFIYGRSTDFRAHSASGVLRGLVTDVGRMNVYYIRRLLFCGSVVSTSRSSSSIDPNKSGLRTTNCARLSSKS